MEKLLNANLVKAVQRAEFEYRIKPYMDWHRSLDRNLYMLDADSIEWRYKKGVLNPVGVMEISRIDGDRPVSLSGTYLSGTIDRFNRDLQGKVTKRLSELLGTYGYIVLFRYNLQEFFVCNFSLDGPWKRYSAEEYRQFLKSL